MADLLTTELSTREMEIVSGGGGGFGIPQINLNVNVSPKININISPSLNFNLGILVVAGNNLNAPLNINFNQFI